MTGRFTSKYKLFGVLFILALWVLPSQNAFAGCGGCLKADCKAANEIIKQNHRMGRGVVKAAISARFAMHEFWWIGTFAVRNLFPAMNDMTAQLDASALRQASVIGRFFDSKEQLEAEREFHLLKAEAHKDYQPSEDFCVLGTASKSLAKADQSGADVKTDFSIAMMQRMTGHKDRGADAPKDKVDRWEDFSKRYCDPRSNGWVDKEDGGKIVNTGLIYVCAGENTPKDKDRIDRDLDYARMIDFPRSINLAEDKALEDISAITSNLYGHNILSQDFSFSDPEKGEGEKEFFLQLRGMVGAKRSVAQNSMASIIALKNTDPAVKKSRDFLAEILKDMGLSDEDIQEMIGNQPSLYATLEILAKRIYQNPDFYASLYDKPANVKRTSVGLRAIELMIDREIYQSRLRQEMLSSVLLAAKLDQKGVPR